MSYFQDYYIKPVRQSIGRWKDFLISSGVEILFLFAVYFLVTLGVSSVLSGLEPLKDNNMDNQAIIMQNAFTYASELESFVSNYYLVMSITILIIFLLSTFTRTFIWNRLLKKRTNYFRNSVVDLVLVSLIAGAYFGVITFFKLSMHSIGFILFLGPVLYYSFFVHLNLKKNLKNIFKVSLHDMMMLLPHTIVFKTVAVILFNLNLGAIYLVILLSFYRIIVLEALNK